MCNASGAQLGVSLKAISSTCAVLLVMLSSLAVGLFPCIRRSSPPNNPPPPLPFRSLASAAIVASDHISALGELEPHVWHSSD